MTITTVVLVFFVLFVGAVPATAQDTEETTIKAWAVAEYGEPLYDEGMPHWPYADPDAPKGGTLVLAEYGGFDSLNTLILRGEWHASIGLTGDSLMTSSADEIGVRYGSLAESVEYPEDVSWAIFTIRPEARYHDGHPVTADDFLYQFELLKEHGRPFLRAIYDPIERAEVLSEHRIKFYFTTRNKMKPLILAAGLGPEPRHWWSQDGRDPTKTFLEPPLGTGEYKLVEVVPDRRLVYERVDDYWGKDLPINRGTYNFDRIVYEFYRDQTVMFEAFKAGGYDIRTEGSELRWATGYDFPAIESGEVVKRAVPIKVPRGISGLFINTRRPYLADVRVRQAINHLFDFEWTRDNILYGYNERSETYFVNSDYGATGLPEGKELEILEPFRDQLPQDLFTEPFDLPETDASGNIRQQLRQALRLFREAGWALRDGRLVNAETGAPFTLEILTVTQDSERWTQPFIRNLERAGITARNTRVPDTATWQRRADEFDFDMFTAVYTFFPPPGTELVSRFHSREAEVPGSANISGVRDPVVDALLDQLVAATDYETLVATTRALDRVLLWGHYIVPFWHREEAWIAYKNIYGIPDRHPRYAIGASTTWWMRELEPQ